MIPRRPLLLITALVLALHALVLGGTAPHWAGAPAEAPPVFATRTVAAPPPAPAARVAEAAPAPAARPAPRKKPRPKPATPAAETTTAPPLIAESASEAGPAAEPAPDSATAQAAPAPETPASPPPADPAPPEAPAAPGSAIAITPPGAAEDAGSPQPPAVRLPAPARLGFDVAGQSKGFQYSARAELLWQHDGQQYQARQEISVLFLGSRTQTSVGEITPLGLQPRRFGDRSRSEQAAHFDFAQGRVTFSANTPSAPIAPGAQDRLSVFLQLGALLAATPQRFAVGTRISIPTVSARAADTWTFTVEGEETLELSMGSLHAVQLQRLPRRDYDQKAQVWLAPGLDYLPARIRITQANGDFAELNLRSHAQP
ncbi:DUF3108 domain-containing protein [Simplicispira lacusdiani]|uniref:DUF3108 domain-containing protein n=1 Tax=Simplicispira lacusdiani TaxID=2213010 RepID=UPI002795EE96|nr:DUF3108 domain-containing protein [Simplicispira lacusdiani]